MTTSSSKSDKADSCQERRDNRGVWENGYEKVVFVCDTCGRPFEREGDFAEKLPVHKPYAYDCAGRAPLAVGAREWYDKDEETGYLLWVGPRDLPGQRKIPVLCPIENRHQVTIIEPPDVAFHPRAHVHARCPECGELFALASLVQNTQGVWVRRNAPME